MPEVKIGDIIVGRYQIENHIAQGGFGDVFLAKRLDQNVHRALKVLRRDSLGMSEKLYQECGERFRIEAQLGAKLNHPHITKAVDYGQDGEMQVLAMEYAAGGSLAERLSGNPQLPIKEAIRIAANIASGLAAMHAIDVVHRDLKPSNVLFDAHGNAKISDLGLAQLPGGASMRSLNSSQLTGAWHPGTRAYMSPEQESSTAYLKSSSDVFSLGVILFEMLTGRNVKNLKPGTKASTLRAEIPTWLDELLSSMLALDPACRPADGSEVLNALQTRAAHRTISRAASFASSTPAAKPSPPPRWMGIIAAGVLLVILGSVVVYLVLNSIGGKPGSLPAALQSPAPQFAGANDIVIEYLVSSANSMAQPWGVHSKQTTVQDALQQHWQGWVSNEPSTAAALRVFGSQYNAADSSKSCLDVDLLSMPVKNPDHFSSLLNETQARGLAPIEEALFAASGDFQINQQKAIILITDSGDTCGGDPCNWAATQYGDAGLEMPIYVLDLGGASHLDCLANFSGGKYFFIQNRSELDTALSTSLQEVTHE